MTLKQWLAQRLDTFEMRCRAGRFKGGRDTYWCAGWAEGYKAAQKEARKSARETGAEHGK